MANEGEIRGSNVGADQEAVSPSGALSPKNRVKFLISHGGKIIQRPVDGQLKYIGGHTRVIAVPRDISFSELMKKISTEFKEDMILKYQVILENLEILVSVRTDEDLRHMFDEYDRQGSKVSPKLRTFLFPSNPTMTENQNSCIDSQPIEQRYTDAINGTLRKTLSFKMPSNVASCPTFSTPAFSSPKSSSLDGNNFDMLHDESKFMNGHLNNGIPMHKVQSSPSLGSLNGSYHESININNHILYQHQQQQQLQHFYPQYQQHHPHGYPNAWSPHDPHRLDPALSMGRHDMIMRRALSLGQQNVRRAQMVNSIDLWYLSRQNMGSGSSDRCVNNDELYF